MIFDDAVHKIIKGLVNQSRISLSQQPGVDAAIVDIAASLDLPTIKELYRIREREAEFLARQSNDEKIKSWSLPEEHLPGEITLEKVGEEVDFALSKFINERKKKDKDL